MKTRISLLLIVSLVLLLIFAALSQAQAPGPYRMFAWLITGNQATNANFNFLGTTDKQPLVIKTDGKEAMRISVSGDVGVGRMPESFTKLAVEQVNGTAIQGSNIKGTYDDGGYGVVGTTNSDYAGAGVYGLSTGAVPGVYGRNETGDGVYGYSVTGWGVAGGSNDGYGVKGTAITPGGVGVGGENNASDYTATAVEGKALYGIGVRGDGGDTGVYGTGAVGVYGLSSGGTGVSGSGGSGNGVAGSSTTGVGVYGFSTSGSGIYGKSVNGNGGYFTSTNWYAIHTDGDARIHGNLIVTGKDTGKAIESDGDVEIKGDLTVTGQVVGFPRPNFDSGWVDVAPGGTVHIIHSLGGNPENYMVDMVFRDNVWGSGIHQITIGSDWRADGTKKGAYWEKLTDTSIDVLRMDDDVRCQQVRIRIWVYN